MYYAFMFPYVRNWLLLYYTIMYCVLIVYCIIIMHYVFMFPYVVSYYACTF